MLHVLAKDVRALWPLLLAWAVMLAVAAWQALWITAPTSLALAFPLQGLPAPMLAGAVVAVAILGDPVMPGRARWMTLPIEARSVVAAKLALYVALLAITVAVQAWIYAGHALPSREVLDLLVHAVAVSVPFMVVLPLGAMLIQDRQWSALFLVGPMMLMAMGAQVLDGSEVTWIFPERESPVPSWVRVVFPVLVASGLASLLYRRGGAHREVRAAGIAAIVVLPYTPRASGPTPAVTAQQPTDTTVARLEHASGRVGVNGDSLKVALMVAPVRGTTTTIVPSRVVARLAGGDSLLLLPQVAWPAYEPIVSRSAATAPGGTVAGDTTRVPQPLVTAVALDAATRARLAGSLVRLDIEGVERRYTSVPAVVLPLRARGTMVGVRRRFRLTGAAPTGDTLLTVVVSTLAPERSLTPDEGEVHNIAYALHVPSRGAFVPLTAPGFEFMPAPMLFFGTHPFTYRSRLVAADPGAARLLLDAPDARLVVFRNEPAGARRVVLTLASAQTPERAP